MFSLRVLIGSLGDCFALVSRPSLERAAVMFINNLFLVLNQKQKLFSSVCRVQSFIFGKNNCFDQLLSSNFEQLTPFIRPDFLPKSIEDMIYSIVTMRVTSIANTAFVSRCCGTRPQAPGLLKWKPGFLAASPLA